MNIEKWINKNTWRGHVDESALRELLKTHAIVPREPSERMVNSASNKYYDISSHVVRGIYSKMITES